MFNVIKRAVKRYFRIRELQRVIDDTCDEGELEDAYYELDCLLKNVKP